MRWSILLALPLIVVATVTGQEAANQQAAPSIPPVPIVYWTEGSTSYHVLSCPLAKTHTMHPTNLEQAVSVHLDPCFVCHPQNDPTIKAYTDAKDAVAAKAAKDAADARAKAAKELADARAKADKEATARAAEADHENRLRPIRRFTELELRGLATKTAELLADGSGRLSTEKYEAFRDAFYKGIRKLDPEYEADAIVLHSSDDLDVMIMPPTMLYVFSATELVRKMEPITAAAWIPYAQVVVAPKTIDSPDIEKVILERDGTAVPTSAEHT